ncbi:MAG: hypothetical protein JRI45_11765, partial [Deltaproteobacteria bacterium]|nr:hypothetical protein [Deltaproteobacteria bacterium]
MVVLQAPVEIAHDVSLKPAKSRVSTGKKTSSNETKDFERVLNKSAKSSSEESIFEDHRAKPVNEDSEKSQENKTDLEREIEKIVADLGLAYFFVPIDKSHETLEIKLNDKSLGIENKIGLEREIEKIVADLGLAYFFVPIDKPHETLEIKLDDKSLGIKDILFRLDDVEEMLMKLGMPSEKIELLAAMSQDGSYIDLPTLLNFLNEKTKELDNIKIPEKIWKKLFRNAALKLENSASENKSFQNTAQISRLEIAKKGEVSLQELKHILNQLQECQKASNNKVMSNSLKVQSNINPKQQLELSERAINLRTATHSSCENSNSNPAPFEPVELNFNPGTKPTLDVKSTELIDVQKMEKVMSNSPKVQSNINPKQQLELSERAINLRTATHSSCENSNSNPAPFEPVELNFNPGTKPTLDVKSTELKGIDIQKMEHVLKPEAIPVGNESTNFQHFTDQGESSLWSQMFFWETGLSTQTPA